MAKRKKKEPDPPPGVPAWMATFSDLVTLLLTFFVMLMAMASFEDSSDLDTVMESLRQALAERGFGEGLVSRVFGDNLSDASRRSSTAKPQVARPRESLDADLSPTTVKVDKTPTEVRMVLDESATFATGSAELLPASRRRIAAIGRVLVDHPVSVTIEGHTDKQGSEDANWRLSTLRALAVLEVLRDDVGMGADRLEARGYGGFRPTVLREADQARNRRIELVLTGDDADTSGAYAALLDAGVVHE